MKKHFNQTQSRLISAKNEYKQLRLDDFHSHKERAFSEMVCKQYQQQQYQKQTMELVHRWLDYEQNAIQTKLQDNVTIIDSRLSVDPEQLNQSLYKSRENPLSIQLVEHFHKNHSIFSKINSNLAQTLINIGTFSIYSKNTSIPYIFYEQKLKNKCNDQKRLGFLLYGRIKLYNKVQKFEKILSQQDCIGEHGIQTIDIDFSQYRNVNVKTISDETAILWIQKHHYEILFKESMKCGLKQQIKKLESLLRLNWIKKSIKKS